MVILWASGKKKTPQLLNGGLVYKFLESRLEEEKKNSKKGTVFIFYALLVC